MTSPRAVASPSPAVPAAVVRGVAGIPGVRDPAPAGPPAAAPEGGDPPDPDDRDGPSSERVRPVRPRPSSPSGGPRGAAASAPPPGGPAPEDIHAALWRAHQLGRGGERVEPSGYPALDAELPGGGWPQRALTELLVAGPGQGEIRLLAPALARITSSGRGVLLLGPPAEPCAEAWLQLGIDLDRCVLVRGDDLLWPLEQALRSGQVGAVLAWPGASLKADALRRLQLAAQSHEGPAFLFRPPVLARQPSPAPLRLSLQAAGPDAIDVQVLKRRGPAREAPLRLELPPTLPPGARERAQRLRPVPAPRVRSVASHP